LAQFIIRNSLNPSKVVKLGITFGQLVVKGNEGDHLWLVEVATDEPHKAGGSIPPEFINLTSLDNLDEEVEKVVEIISNKVDWTPLEEDIRPPIVESCHPSDYTVSIETNVKIVLEDLLPATGIDVDSIKMIITTDDKDFNVTSELDIDGDPYEYTVGWKPFMRVYDEN